MIEDYRPGYPQYAALLGSADNFLAFRRFRRLRSRLILLRQDKVAALERELDRLDSEETQVWNLCQLRLDENQERQKLLLDIERELAEYGKKGQRLPLLRPNPNTHIQIQQTHKHTHTHTRTT